MEPLVRLAEGYTTRFHPVALLKKQVRAARTSGQRTWLPNHGRPSGAWPPGLVVLSARSCLRQLK